MSEHPPTTLIEQLKNFEPAALKHTNVQEKTVLPTKEDIVTERRVKSVMQGVESFDRQLLKTISTDVQERTVLPTNEDIITERRVKSVLQGVESFDKQLLRSVSTDEKQVIPDKETIELERKDIELHKD